MAAVAVKSKRKHAESFDIRRAPREASCRAGGDDHLVQAWIPAPAGPMKATKWAIGPGPGRTLGHRRKSKNQTPKGPWLNMLISSLAGLSCYKGVRGTSQLSHRQAVDTHLAKLPIDVGHSILYARHVTRQWRPDFTKIATLYDGKKTPHLP